MHMIERAHRAGTLLLAVSLLLAMAATAGAQEERTFTAEEIAELTIWDGEPIVFTKADGADPNQEDNQDRITDSVWITRGNRGGQIYNAVERDSADKTRSPLGTLWAEGTTDDLPDLVFKPFRAADGKPQVSPDRSFVLFIEEEGIFIDVTFLSWSQRRQGGFSYERSTP